MSDLEPICPIIKDMTNHDFNFLDRWLSEAPISKKEVEDHIRNQDLDLWQDIGDHISQDSREAYQKALSSGLPPLPKAAKHFRNICFRLEDNFLSPRHDASLWKNLGKPCYKYVSLSLSDTAFRQGLNKMRCKHLSLENMVGDWSFDDMPKLGIKGKLSVLQIRRCSDAPRLAEL